MTSPTTTATYPGDRLTVLDDEARRHLTELGRRHLDHEPGYFRLTGLSFDSVEAAGQFSLDASAALGQLLPQDGHGTLLRQVTDRGVRLGEGRTGRYSDSRQGGSLHTDAPHKPAPVPDCFARYCVHQAPVGGELCLVSVDSLLERLSAQAIKQLGHDFHFDRRDDTADTPTVVRPVLELDEHGPRMFYLREYIDIGHRHEHVPALTAAQTEALDALDALLGDESLQQRLRLETGEMVFINNRRLLHGRTEFEDGDDPGSKRMMLRTWILRSNQAN
jgi:alpha-ketoglutarate-dependent taurine dioxygenase